MAAASVAHRKGSDWGLRSFEVLGVAQVKAGPETGRADAAAVVVAPAEPAAAGGLEPVVAD